MLRRPTLHRADLTVAEAHAALADPHVHLLLLVEGTRLVGTLDREDLAAALDDDAPARAVAVLEGRTTAPGTPLAPLAGSMRAAGLRRLAVVGEGGTLLGLLALKRSGAGFCSDAGVAARSAARAAAARPGA